MLELDAVVLVGLGEMLPDEWLDELTGTVVTLVAVRKLLFEDETFTLPTSPIARRLLLLPFTTGDEETPDTEVELEGAT